VPALSELQRLELIVEVRRRPTPEYRFRHGLVQEVAYASLVEPRRRRLHLQVGEALERLLGEAPEPAYALLARHFSEADEPARATDYLLKAGDAARAVYADQEAIAHYERARSFLARLDDEARARDTLFKIALARHIAFDFAGAEAAYDEAFCCRVDEPARTEPTERIETAMAPLAGDLAPGFVYDTGTLSLVAQLFRGLLAVDRDLNVVPSAADNFRVSADGLTYLFRLREGVRWSDGEPLTAEDFAWTWQQMRAQNVPTAFLLDGVEAEALDDRTLEVRLDAPRSYFPYVLACAWTFPWPRHRCRELGEAWRRPEHLVGNGPFVLAERDDDHLLLVSNPHFAGPRGNVREIHAEFHPADVIDPLEEWRAGRHDVLLTSQPVAADEPDTIRDTYPDLGLSYVGFRADRPPFSNALVRRAFAHALDRERFAAATGTIALPATRGGAIPPAMPGHTHRAGLHYDLELARSLLAEAGYPDGKGLPPLRFVLHPWTQPETFVEQLSELGARFEFHLTSGPVACADVADAHLWFAGWTADYPDPDGLFRGLFAADWPFYRDEEIDDLLARSHRSLDQGERMRLFHELDRLWVGEHAAIVPILYPRVQLLRRPWVEDCWAGPLTGPVADLAVVHRS
jgi:oligopeptide transport system substrate-binding protein